MENNIKMVLNEKMGESGLYSPDSRQAQMAGIYEHCNEISASIKRVQILQ